LTPQKTYVTVTVSHVGNGDWMMSTMSGDRIFLVTSEVRTGGGWTTKRTVQYHFTMMTRRKGADRRLTEFRCGAS